MALTDKEVRHVANLARLEMRDEEIETIRVQLDAILGYVEKLNQLKTDGVDPTFHVLPMNNVFREDVVRQPLGQEVAISNAPEKADGCFRVPKVVE